MGKIQLVTWGLTYPQGLIEIQNILHLLPSLLTISDFEKDLKSLNTRISRTVSQEAPVEIFPPDKQSVQFHVYVQKGFLLPFYINYRYTL